MYYNIYFFIVTIVSMDSDPLHWSDDDQYVVNDPGDGDYQSSADDQDKDECHKKKKIET